MENSIMTIEQTEHELQAQLNDGFEQVKAASASRWSKIRAILVETLPKLWTELVAGTQELIGIVREVAQTMAQVVQHKLQTTGYVKAAILKKDAKKWRQNLMARAKTLWNNHLRSIVNHRVIDLKAQAAQLDDTLAARYGNQYQTAKQRVDGFIAAYKASQTSVAPPVSHAAIEVPYQIVEEAQKPA
jgi:hypothetical protein